MSDRELLELAAKAAGWFAFDWLSWDGVLNVYSIDGMHEKFDPLNDDGDALRLAVKLHINIQHSATLPDLLPSIEAYGTEDITSESVEEMIGVDPCAATRRVIVRAAAEIGRAMP